MNSIKKQVNFCGALMEKIVNNAYDHENARSGKFHAGVDAGRSWTPGMVDKAGCAKSQIQADIKLLRRELMNLSKMFDFLP